MADETAAMMAVKKVDETAELTADETAVWMAASSVVWMAVKWEV
jgi:hypothetical protein